jgi:hypothetical protein
VDPNPAPMPAPVVPAVPLPAPVVPAVPLPAPVVPVVPLPAPVVPAVPLPAPVVPVVPLPAPVAPPAQTLPGNVTTQSNEPVKVETEWPPQIPGLPGGFWAFPWTVKPGEDLNVLADQGFSQCQWIGDCNPGVDMWALKPGQTVNVGRPVYMYTVKAGDTFENLAARNIAWSAAALAKYNPEVHNGNLLQPGSKIRLIPK